MPSLPNPTLAVGYANVSITSAYLYVGVEDDAVGKLFGFFLHIVRRLMDRLSKPFNSANVRRYFYTHTGGG